MKKLLFSGIVLSLLLWSCKKKAEPDYASLVHGAWVNTHVDNKAIQTDASFFFEFRSDNVQPFACGYSLDENNKTWLENDNYTYLINGKNVIIDGVNVLGKKFHMEFEILSVDDHTLSYAVSKFMIDNVEYPDPKTYTNKKVTTDFQNKLVGTWYGKSITPGSMDDSYHYWDYLADGHFDYYYQDDKGNWINKPDNEGFYFLYGDLLASNYTNDLISGERGKAFECWNISIEGNTMLWNGLRENGLITSFRMEKVACPPVFSGK
jgi:hypothetical protein